MHNGLDKQAAPAVQTAMLKNIRSFFTHMAWGALALAGGWAAHAAPSEMRPASNALGRHICTVVHVYDGDSFDVRCKKGTRTQRIMVRMSNVDAPEHGQPYGDEAKALLQSLVLRKRVQLNCYKRDGHKGTGGRHVCAVRAASPSSPNGPMDMDVELALLTQGAVWWYKGFAHERTLHVQKQYEWAQNEARAKRIGLWAHASPQEPWLWRRKQQRPRPRN